MVTDPAIEKIVRIVDFQSSPEQPDTVAKHTITMLATKDGLSLSEANAALDGALERGLLVEEEGRFRVT